MNKKILDENKPDFFDVVISGGGLSGCLTALSLADLRKPDGSKLSIAIIESQPLLLNSASVKISAPKANTLFDQRVLALSHHSARYLQQLGLWPLLKNKVQPIEKIHISDRGHYGKTRLTATDYQVAALGYVIEMSFLGKCLLSTLANKSNVTWYAPNKISSIDWQPEQVNITLCPASELADDKAETAANNIASGETNIPTQVTTHIQTSLLLGCDGAQSVCRHLANIEVTDTPYEQTAIIANVITEQPHHNVAYERFTEYGPIAMLPLAGQFPDRKSKSGNTNPAKATNTANTSKAGNACSLVWTLTPEQAQRISTLDDSAFKVELEKAFGSWLGEINAVSQRFSYPLHLVQAHSQTYHRMALVGNASHTIHPIAGQGFNLGLRDVKCLASLIAQTLTNHPDKAIQDGTNQYVSNQYVSNQGDSNHDIGDAGLLLAYQENRQTDHQQTINLTDSLVTLFSNDLTPLTLGRTIGLNVLNYVTPLKNALVKKAMGY